MPNKTKRVVVRLTFDEAQALSMRAEEGLMDLEVRISNGGKYAAEYQQQYDVARQAVDKLDRARFKQQPEGEN